MTDVHHHEIVVIGRDEFSVSELIERLQEALAEVPDEYRADAKVSISGYDDDTDLVIAWEAPKTLAEIKAEIEPRLVILKERLARFKAAGFVEQDWLLHDIAKYEKRIAAAELREGVRQ